MVRSSRTASRLLSRALSQRAMDPLLSNRGALCSADSRCGEDGRRVSQNSGEDKGFVGPIQRDGPTLGEPEHNPYRGVILRRAGLFAVVMLFTLAWPAIAENGIENGRAILQKCASCHAIGRTGESPHKLAPPFRTLGQRYPIESLEEALARASCPAIQTCRNFNLMTRKSVTLFRI
jgi:hypothetical protein